MSKYKPERTKTLEKNLDEKVNQLKRIQSELEPLIALKQTVKTSIGDLMTELDIDEYKGVYKVSDTTVVTDIQELLENKPSLKEYLVGVIDKKATISIMYNNHIHYDVAKRTVETAIENSKYKEIQHEEVKLRNE